MELGWTRMNSVDSIRQWMRSGGDPVCVVCLVSPGRGNELGMEHRKRKN